MEIHVDYLNQYTDIHCLDTLPQSTRVFLQPKTPVELCQNSSGVTARLLNDFLKSVLV